MLGDPLDDEAGAVVHLTHLTPTAERVSHAGAAQLEALGVAPHRARTIVAIASAIVRGIVRLEPGSDIAATRRSLSTIENVDDVLASTIVMRAMKWPDAFPLRDSALRRIASASRLPAIAPERCRPWRSYAFLHLMQADRSVPGRVVR